MSESIGVIEVVNSFIGKVGNIGQRTGFILDQFKIEGISCQTISRGLSVAKYKNSNNSMGLLGHIPRILNAYRIYVNINFNMRRYDRILFEKFACRKFKKVAKQFATKEFKILHCWEYLPKLIDLAKKSGFKVVLDVPIAPSLYSQELHDQNLMLLDHYDFKGEYQLEMETFHNADLIIAPSDFVKNTLLRYGLPENKIRVVPFGVDTTDNEVKEYTQHNNVPLKFVFAGSINRRKGIKFLLEAFKHPDLEKHELHLCGRLFPEQAAEIKASGLKNIYLPGFIDTKEYFKTCDIYIFPTLMEGSSKSVYEAMAAGLPIITTPAAGTICRDQIEALIVPIGDIVALQSAALELQADKEKRKKMGLAAFQRVKDFTWPIYANKVVSIMRELASQPTCLRKINTNVTAKVL